MVNYSRTSRMTTGKPFLSVSQGIIRIIQINKQKLTGIFLKEFLKCSHDPAHQYTGCGQLIFRKCFIQVRIESDPESIPGTLGVSQEYTLDGVEAILSHQSNPAMTLEGVKKPENLGETHADIERMLKTPHELRIEPGTLDLWDRNATSEDLLFFSLSIKISAFFRSCSCNDVVH